MAGAADRITLFVEVLQQRFDLGFIRHQELEVVAAGKTQVAVAVFGDLGADERLRGAVDTAGRSLESMGVRATIDRVLTT